MNDFAARSAMRASAYMIALEPVSLERSARRIYMRRLAERLATAFLAGSWEADALSRRGASIVAEPGRWLTRLARRIHLRGAARGALARETVVDWILCDPTFILAVERYDLDVAVWLSEEAPPMQPAARAPSTWPLPSITTVGQLAAWLGVPVNELEWFAGWRGRRKTPAGGRLSHYRYRAVRKRHGEVRLLEVPKPRLRDLQRQLLRRLLDLIPPHEAAHGFRGGRSSRSFAAPHAGRRVVLRLDLADFFPTIHWHRVRAVFLSAGYPDSVASLLAGLCTHSTHAGFLDSLDLTPSRHWRLRRLHGRAHLPQGAPTSPALSNLIAFRLDCRLSALAAAAGARYTRYADDLAFSGDETFATSARRFHTQVAAIALEEGFEINARKTRIMRAGIRQRLAGIVVNRHPNLARHDYDRLKALLHNCVAYGPHTQNHQNHADFRAHLAGKIAYVEMLNPSRARRLRELFNRIDW